MASPPRFVFVLADPDKTLALKGLVRQGIDVIGSLYMDKKMACLLSISSIVK